MSSWPNYFHSFTAVLTLEEPPVAEVKTTTSPVPFPRFEFQHIPELDGLRGTAILCVVAGHYLEFHNGNATARALANSMAQTGVLLFFVLSGFLITGLLCREYRFTGAINFKAFYVRRVLRLAPALLLFFATVILLMTFGLITDVNRRELLECLFYSRNIFGHSMTLGHIWSLSLEEQFYLLWPLTFSLLPLKSAARLVACVCGAFMLWRALAIALQLFSYDRGIYYVRPYFRFDSILIGALLALCICNSAKSFRSWKSAASRHSCNLILVPLVVWVLFAEPVLRPLYITVAEALVAALLVHVVLARNSWLAATLRNSWLRYIGTISYSLYLWQELFVTANNPPWGWLRSLPFAVLLPLAIAMTSFQLMERPILSWKSRFAPQV